MSYWLVLTILCSDGFTTDKVSIAQTSADVEDRIATLIVENKVGVEDHDNCYISEAKWGYE